MSNKYSPAEVAIKVLQKTEELLKSSIGGLKPTTVSPIPGVVSPNQSNSASPMKAGSQAVVKMAKPKKMGQATDKPSVFFKSDDFQGVKKSSIENLRVFLERQRAKNRA